MSTLSLRRFAGAAADYLFGKPRQESSAASLHLTEEERARYRDEGYFVRERVFGGDDLERLRAAVESIHHKISAARSDADETRRLDGRKFQTTLGSLVKWEWHAEEDAIRSMEPIHHLEGAIDRLIDDERLVTPVRDLIGSEGVSLFTDKLNFKRPGGSPFPWHQDAPYWAFGCPHVDELASVQIYLDDATVENGCLWVIPGSHRQGHIQPPPVDGVLQRLYTDVDLVPELPRKPLVAPAGSVIFFDGYIVHGSQSNRTQADRRAIIFTYQPAGRPLWNQDTVRVPVAQRQASQTDRAPA